jgi:hypothetical protein
MSTRKIIRKGRPPAYAYVRNSPLSETDPAGLCTGNTGNCRDPKNGNSLAQNWDPLSIIDVSYVTDPSGYINDFTPASLTSNGYVDDSDYIETSYTWTPQVDNYIPIGQEVITGQYFVGGSGSADGPSWWGTFAKTFFSNLVSKQFYEAELKDGGCLAAFGKGIDEADPLGAYIPADSPVVETTIKAGGASVAAVYVGYQGLSVPLRSSIVRDILAGGETGATYFAPVYIDAQLAWGVYREAAAAINGKCQ